MSITTRMKDGRYELKVNGTSFRAKTKEKLFNSPVRSAHIFTDLRNGRKNLHLAGIFLFYDPHRLLTASTKYAVLCNQREYPLNPSRRYRPSRRLRLWRFVFLFHNTKIPYHDFSDARIHNSVYVTSRSDEGFGMTKPVRYSFLDRGTSRWKNKRVRVLPHLNSTIYVKQNKGNTLGITVRRTLSSDSRRKQLLLSLAWLAAKLSFWRKTTLIYEKESARYEESGSVVYEQLIDEGRGGFHFIIDRTSEHMALIPEKYKSKLVYKNTFRHYYYFFLCDNFIGTEMPPHSIDIRIANKKVLTKLESRDYGFVFLQHGVCYMVSLASTSRSYFRKDSGYFPDGRTRIVVSSQLEADHFIEYGGFKQEELYVVGLPKFDRATRKKRAPKIVIMPTWRPWEYNIIRTNPESAPYYKMLLSIFDAVPDELKQFVHILPHPIFVRELKDSPLAQYIKDDVTYDEVLRETDLLITDYSSISYDAFYRGSNVIFWWKEKDYCMEQYGGFLMLKEDMAFGDVVYDQKALEASIEKRYSKPQPDKYINRYREIVEYHDGNNTARLIAGLEKDEIIS